MNEDIARAIADGITWDIIHELSDIHGIDFHMTNGSAPPEIFDFIKRKVAGAILDQYAVIVIPNTHHPATKFEQCVTTGRGYFTGDQCADKAGE